LPQKSNSRQAAAPAETDDARAPVSRLTEPSVVR